MRVAAIIAAGGSGRRFGGAVPKQLVTVGGQPILARSVTLFITHPDVHEVVLALPADLCREPPGFLSGERRVRVVEGGETRQASVTNAFRQTSADADVIVIHDAARPFASADLVSRTIAAAARSGAALAALAARDTVKRTTADAGSDRPRVAETLDRGQIVLAQTPQAFRREVLERALALAAREGITATDEAALAERIGQDVEVVAGEEANIKVTVPEDLVVAEALAGAGRPARTGRAGTGYDLHRLVEGRPLVLGGVTIPSSRGALGHSDADVVCHAVTDAILGAAALGNIGSHFPDSDPAWKDASSVELLKRAVLVMRDHGLQVGNLDVTVILESPKIAPHIDAMRRIIAEAAGVDVARVSIKGKTNEGVDAVGRGEAIAAHAVALIRQI